ncbi:hypothetical protein FRC14_000472 [Serendipita sp. 396]|nr:hypothetical protein FRC14_000472 [Serendipita sp. 396]KAG8786071.1 hypothetical protein FRC15_000164 [Serendipita sp. 397]KAG8861076.1 hypothetical protein FRB91_009876 [Serendipita sp. 411]KAG8868634.1 hypothetical protein FRC20_003048 [Serendipita sp. 405]KAG9056413.1 hypothetical protein FS842_010747 [Serendipita sp. 407]
MAFNDLDDSNDRMRYRNYAHRIGQRADQESIEAKLVVMGNTGVGKSSLVVRYTENRFSLSTTATTGALFVTHKTNFEDFHVKLQIWDTAGQERFRSLAPIYYRGANAAIIMYDLTRLESFNDVRIWIEELKKNCDPDLLIYIVGSKADLVSQRQVTPDHVRSCLHKWFPPPRRPDPETRPPTSPSIGQGINAYLRPRFTSLTSAYTVNSGSSAGSGVKVNLARANTTAGLQSPRKDGGRFNSFQSFDALPTSVSSQPPRAIVARKAHHRERSWGPSGSVGVLSFPTFGNNGSRDLIADAVSDEEEEEDEPEWGLGKYMQLFEVSAKDASGIQTLFNAILAAVMERREAIEAERKARERDSVLLHVPYGTVPEEDESKDKDAPQRSWCC